MADILITSAILPPIPITLGGSASGGKPSLAMRLIRPRVQVLTPNGPDLVDVAPGGEPGNTWPLVGIGAAALLTLLLVFAVKGALR